MNNYSYIQTVGGSHMSEEKLEGQHVHCHHDHHHDHNHQTGKIHTGHEFDKIDKKIDHANLTLFHKT